MKFIDKYQKFRESTIGLWLLAIISILAGLGLLISPETTPRFIIQGVGLLWILEGVSYVGKLIIKHIESRIKSRTNRR